MAESVLGQMVTESYMYGLCCSDVGRGVHVSNVYRWFGYVHAGPPSLLLGLPKI